MKDFAEKWGEFLQPLQFPNPKRHEEEYFFRFKNNWSICIIKCFGEAFYTAFIYNGGFTFMGNSPSFRGLREQDVENLLSCISSFSNESFLDN